MGTETTRVSSYIRSEGFLDSAGTRYQNASAVNLLVSGLTTSITASALNNVFSGITASANASQISNLFSGLASTVTAGLVTSYVARAVTADAALAATTAATAAAATTALAAASASYAASAGALSGLTATMAQVNALLYGTKYKVAFGSALATDVAVMSCVTNCGISTALFALVTPHTTGIIAGGVATQTGVQWMIATHAGTATQAVVDFCIIGNA